MIFNVPNLITIGRIAVIPLLVWLLNGIPGADPHRDKVLSFWAMVVFAAAGISDLVDGYYARKYGQVSTMGKFFDPMADKLIHMTAMVFLIPINRMAAWLVAALLFREIFITGLRSMAAGEGIIIDAGDWGKKKTAWLNVGLSGLILHYPVFAGTFFELNTVAVANFCMVVGFFFAIASGIQYSVVFFNRARDL